MSIELKAIDDYTIRELRTMCDSEGLPQYGDKATVYGRLAERYTAGIPEPEFEYMVMRPFKYDGRLYAIGDGWTPTGSKNDSLLVAQGKFVQPASQNDLERARKVKQAAMRPAKAEVKEYA